MATMAIPSTAAAKPYPIPRAVYEKLLCPLEKIVADIKVARGEAVIVDGDNCGQ